MEHITMYTLDMSSFSIGIYLNAFRSQTMTIFSRLFLNKQINSQIRFLERSSSSWGWIFYQEIIGVILAANSPLINKETYIFIYLFTLLSYTYTFIGWETTTAIANNSGPNSCAKTIYKLY